MTPQLDEGEKWDLGLSLFHSSIDIVIDSGMVMPPYQIQWDENVNHTKEDLSQRSLEPWAAGDWKESQQSRTYRDKLGLGDILWVQTHLWISYNACQKIIFHP